MKMQDVIRTMAVKSFGRPRLYKMPKPSRTNCASCDREIPPGQPRECAACRETNNDPRPLVQKLVDEVLSEG